MRQSGVVDAGLAAIVGALIGGLTTTLGSLFASSRAATRERLKEERAARELAYGNAIRFLLRVQNRRSEVGPGGTPFLSKEAQPEWFLDLIEAQYWMTWLLTVCTDANRPHLDRLASRFGDLVNDIVAGKLLEHSNIKRKAGEPALPELQAICVEVVALASNDLVGRPGYRSA
jgi:hypothetical protein